VTRVPTRVFAWLGLALVAATLTHAPTADASVPPFVAVGHSPTQGTPVPGAYLTADLGAWTSPPESYEFQWLRDGSPIAGATTQDYAVQVTDIGHQLTPHVTGHSGADVADFVGTSMVVRKLGSELRLDVRRAHPPGKNRLAWTAITFMTTERPWATDGGTMTAYKVKDGELKALARGVVARNAAFIRLPWKRAPLGKTRLVVCYDGSDVVEASCSPFDVVRRSPHEGGR